MQGPWRDRHRKESGPRSKSKNYEQKIMEQREERQTERDTNKA